MYDLAVAGYDPYADCGDCRFDVDAAMRSIEFVERFCTHVKGEYGGKPIDLQDHARRMLANIFGWKRPDGTRRYRVVFLYVPRKNAKTTICACIALYMLEADGEAGAEVYSAAGKREQAGLLFDYMAGMVRQDPVLLKRLRVYETYKSIVSRTNRANRYKALSSDAGLEQGLNTHCGILDEMHVQSKIDLRQAISLSMGARRQPLFVMATTADVDRPDSVCNEELSYAERVRDGGISDRRYLPVIFSTPADADWEDPAVWKAANPGWGTSVNPVQFEEDFQEAKNDPRKQNDFKRYRLNMMTEQAVRWLDMADWRECSGGDVEQDSLLGQMCYGGLDLASVDDLNAFVLFFPDMMACLCWFWVPSESVVPRRGRTVEGRRYHAVGYEKYPQWVAEGFIRTMEGNCIDPGVIEADVVEICELYDVQDIGYDRYNCVHLANRLQDVHGIEMVQYPQTIGALNEPCMALEGMVTGQKFCHFGNPVLMWMAGNVCVRINDQEQMMPSKRHSGGKIDGIMSLLMAYGRWMAMSTENTVRYDEVAVCVDGVEMDGEMDGEMDLMDLMDGGDDEW